LNDLLAYLINTNIAYPFLLYPTDWTKNTAIIQLNETNCTSLRMICPYYYSFTCDYGNNNTITLNELCNDPINELARYVAYDANDINNQSWRCLNKNKLTTDTLKYISNYYTDQLEQAQLINTTQLLDQCYNNYILMKILHINVIILIMIHIILMKYQHYILVKY
jgi:hypothetical protein